MDTLRFGASEEVNFGRGCKVHRSEAAGNDLIITFNGIGNGLTKENFAAKLLGSTKNGGLLIGYASTVQIIRGERCLCTQTERVVEPG